MAIVIATLWLYFGNIRTKSNTGKIILTLEELMESNTRYSARIMDITENKDSRMRIRLME